MALVPKPSLSFECMTLFSHRQTFYAVQAGSYILGLSVRFSGKAASINLRKRNFAESLSGV